MRRDCLPPSTAFGFGLLMLASALCGAAEPRTPPPGGTPPPVSAPSAGAPQSATGKWLAEQDSQWQAAYEREVQVPFERVLTELKRQYLAVLEAHMLIASREAKLDDAVAFRAERDLVAVGGDVPAGEDAAAPAALNALRTGFARKLAALAGDRSAKAKALHARYDAILAQNQTALTQRQRFDEALEIKVRREKLSAAWLDQPAPMKADPAQPVDLFASGNNDLEIYINDKEVIPDARRESPTRVRVELREGDVIAVKNGDRFDINCFWLSCISPSGQFMFETSERWISYDPADSGKWWIIKNPKDQKPAAFAPDSQEYVNLVKRSASETPFYHGAQPIRSTVKPDRRAGYLYYVVTKADLQKTEPKMKVK